MDLHTLAMLLSLCSVSSVGVLQVPLHRSVVSPALTSKGSVLLYHTVDVDDWNAT